MNQIEHIIKTALQSHDNQIRDNAEKEIYRLVEHNFMEFFNTISLIIEN